VPNFIAEAVSKPLVVQARSTPLYLFVHFDSDLQDVSFPRFQGHIVQCQPVSAIQSAFAPRRFRNAEPTELVVVASAPPTDP